MSMDMRNPGVLDKVPEYPKVNDGYVLVQKWIQSVSGIKKAGPWRHAAVS